MPLLERDNELIDKAILEELSSQEKEEFSSRMKDEKFRKEWEMRKSMVSQVVLEGRKQMKGQLNKWETDIAQGKRKNRARWKGILLAFCVLILIIVILNKVFFRQGPTDINGEELFYAFYEPYPNEIDPLTKSVDEIKLSPFQLYESGRSLEAISLLDKNEMSDEETWYLALAYMDIDSLKSSSLILDKITTDPEHRYFKQAKWYLALCKLKTGQNEEGASLLKDIQNERNNPYKNKATELLSQIEN